MSAKTTQAKRLHKRLHRMTRSSARAVQKTITTLGDLISAAYEVGGSEDAAERILSRSPLANLIDRRIVFAH
ncbi:MAG TPA: hypothetical protein VGK67_01525 [Myxococcales bacterium]|jgi:hypothetical protein